MLLVLFDNTSASMYYFRSLDIGLDMARFFDMTE
jgi:hypothetical protein